MKRILVNEHRIDTTQIAHYHANTTSIGGCHGFPFHYLYEIIIGMKSGQDISISCRDEEGRRGAKRTNRVH